MRVLICLLALSFPAFSQAIPATSLIAGKFSVSVVQYNGKPATRAVDAGGNGDGGPVIVKDAASFHNGSMDVDLAGRPATDAPDSARGFVGMAFRIQADGKYEVIYLRPTNGRADDQLRRNHSVQYASEPDWPWSRLRGESPGVYESYVDLDTAAWTHYRITVKGTRAELFVNGASQPCLIVKDLKLGDVSGGLGLWVGLGSETWFSNLKVIRDR